MAAIERSRLMPVASIGGEIVGIRLARWRVPDTCAVSASVIVEVLVTMAVQYAGLCAVHTDTGHGDPGCAPWRHLSGD
jgi:hypothetical protein